MATTGVHGASGATDRDNKWTGEANVTANDDSYATFSHARYARSELDISFGDIMSHIPVGATIDGVEIKLYAKISDNALIPNIEVNLIDDMFATIGITKHLHFSGTTEEILTYGSSSDNWSASSSGLATFVGASVNSYSESAGSFTFSVDYVTAEITYTEAAGPATVKTVNGLAKASVKTLRSGVLIASGKTFNGLA